jgi:hypothetical protein
MKFLQIILDKYKQETAASPISKMLSLVNMGGERKRRLESTKRSVFFLPDELRIKVEESVLRDLHKTFEGEGEEETHVEELSQSEQSFMLLKRMKFTYDEHIASQPVQLLIPALLVSIALLKVLFHVIFSS